MPESDLATAKAAIMDALVVLKALALFVEKAGGRGAVGKVRKIEEVAVILANQDFVDHLGRVHQGWQRDGCYPGTRASDGCCGSDVPLAPPEEGGFVEASEESRTNGIVAYLSGDVDELELSPVSATVKEIPDSPVFEDPKPIKISTDQYGAIIGTLIGDFETGDAHLSYSQLSTFRSCPAQWAYSRMNKDTAWTFYSPETPAWWNIGGTAVHACLERDGCEFQEEFDRQIDIAEIETSIPREEFRAAKRKTEGLDYWLTVGQGMVDKGLRMIDDQISEGLVVSDREVEFSRPLAGREGSTNVVGKVDLILTDTRSVKIVDFKTGGSAPVGCQQLALYAWLRHGVARVDGEYWMLRDGKNPIHFGPLDDTLQTPVVSAMEVMLDAILTGRVHENPDKHCFFCHYRTFCKSL